MGKKKQYIMDAEKEIFLHGNAASRKEDEALVAGCIANGISEEAALTIWGKMVEFAKYALIFYLTKTKEKRTLNQYKI